MTRTTTGRPWPASRPAVGADTTRVARGDVAMGTGIVTTNADAIAPRVRDLIAVLQGWLAELERPGGPDPNAVEERLRIARERLDALPR